MPDRDGAAGEGFAGPAASTSYGMTWIALVLLLFMVVVVGWRLVDFWDSRQPPAGVQAQEATVLGYEELGRSRPGDGSPEYASIRFELADGTSGSALYQLRRLGSAEKGDTITVYRQGEEWRTTSEKAWGSTLLWAAGLVLLLMMIVGWFRVRARTRSGRSPF